MQMTNKIAGFMAVLVAFFIGLYQGVKVASIRQLKNDVLARTIFLLIR